MALNKLIALTGLTLMLAGCVQEGGRPTSSNVNELEDQALVLARSRTMTPSPPWAQGDQLGMGNTLGPGTWLRCAQHLAQPGARVYELSHVRHNDMPSSPWGLPVRYEYQPTAGLAGTRHAWHGGERITGEPGQQGTQIDALGHFGYLQKAWDGESEFPAAKAMYYGGYTQAEVKPSPGSPLLKLGIDQVPPIVTSAVLLDAKTLLGGGEPMNPGQQINAVDIEQMIQEQGLGWRGLLPGDVVYIFTGWGDNWNTDHYYTGGPGLSYDAARYLEEKNVVLVALDNPFTDAVNEGQFTGKTSPPGDTPTELPSPVHHHNLTQAGIHNIQNANLAALAEDRVWISCTMILPLRVKGGSGSPVRPIAIGVPSS